MHPYGILSNFKQFLDSLRGRGMRYIFHGTEEEWDALTDAEKDRYDQAELSGGTDNSCPIYVSQQVAEGDLNPVSSDAVYNALKDYEDSNKVTTVTLTKPSGLSITAYDCYYVKTGKVVVVYIYIVLTTDLAASTVFVQGLPKAAYKATEMLSSMDAATNKLRAYIHSGSTDITNQDISANAGTYLGQLVYIAAD